MNPFESDEKFVEVQFRQGNCQIWLPADLAWCCEAGEMKRVVTDAIPARLRLKTGSSPA